MKNKDIHIKISDEKYQLLKKLADKEYRKISAILIRAIDNFLIIKKLIKG